MERRMKELLPNLRRLHHLHELTPVHREMIARKPPRVIEFQAKDSANESRHR